MQKIKDTYSLWYSYYNILPRPHRYSLGTKIDQIFIEIIEATSIAIFLKQEEKYPHIISAIRKIDVSKILLMVLWETKSLDNKKYIALSTKIEEIGKILGGWKGQILKTKLP